MIIQKKLLLSIGRISDKKSLLLLLKKLDQNRFNLLATENTHKFLKKYKVKSELVYKISQYPKKPNLADLLEDEVFDVIINIPMRRGQIRNGEYSDGRMIRKAALKTKTVLITDSEVTMDFLKSLL